MNNYLDSFESEKTYTNLDTNVDNDVLEYHPATVSSNTITNKNIEDEDIIFIEEVVVIKMKKRVIPKRKRVIITEEDSDSSLSIDISLLSKKRNFIKDED